MAEHNDIGKIGEDITEIFLKKNNFSIIERNYRTKYGEVDIIARKDNVLHFIEVKSVKVRDCCNITNLSISPEDNLTYVKWQKICITVENYLKHKNITPEETYQIDLACVYINTEKREGRVELMQNVYKEKR